MANSQDFTILEPADINRLRQDEEASEMYLDSLALVDDVICEFPPDGDHPRESDISAIKQHLDHLYQQIPDFGRVKRNAVDNFVTAEKLRQEALHMQDFGERSRELEARIARFRDQLIEQYTVVARAY